MMDYSQDKHTCNPAFHVDSSNKLTLTMAG